MENNAPKTAEEWADEIWDAVDAANENAILAAVLKQEGPMTREQELMVHENLFRHADPKAGMVFMQRTWLGRILFDYGPIAWIIRGIGSLIDR